MIYIDRVEVECEVSIAEVLEAIGDEIEGTIQVDCSVDANDVLNLCNHDNIEKRYDEIFDEVIPSDFSTEELLEEINCRRVKHSSFDLDMDAKTIKNYLCDRYGVNHHTPKEELITKLLNELP